MSSVTETRTSPERPEKPPQQQRRWKRLRLPFSIITGAITLYAALVPAVGLSYWQPWRPHTVYYTFIKPLPHEITPEPCAFTAVVQGKPPPVGWVMVISTQVLGVGDNVDPYLHYGKAVRMQNTNKYYDDVHNGIRKTSAGTTYKLTAWLMPAGEVAKMIRESHHNWWNRKYVLSGAKQVATATVTRKRSRHPNC